MRVISGLKSLRPRSYFSSNTTSNLAALYACTWRGASVWPTASFGLMMPTLFTCGYVLRSQRATLGANSSVGICTRKLYLLSGERIFGE